jgi:hypothetical protein
MRKACTTYDLRGGIIPESGFPLDYLNKPIMPIHRDRFSNKLLNTAIVDQISPSRLSSKNTRKTGLTIWRQF